MKTTWKFNIRFDSRRDSGIASNVLFLESPASVSEMATIAGGTMREIRTTLGGREIYRCAYDVELDENDPKLSELLMFLGQRYGYKPSPIFIPPVELRRNHFQVMKWRTYDSADWDKASMLLVRSRLDIATHYTGTVEQIDKEQYVAELDNRQKSKAQLGFMFPFQGVAIDGTLAKALQASGLRGLKVDEPVAFVPEGRKITKPLYKLSTEVIAPRSLLPVISEQGVQVEPNTTWPCYFDDAGYQPEELRYPAAAQEALTAHDIVMSFEQTGVYSAKAYRRCLVSQKFRAALAKLKVKGVEYVPVRFV